MNDYRKILEGVVNIINNTTEKSDIVSNICSYIDENCPELKESKDERIRKQLIKYFNDVKIFSSDLKVEDIIAWLEKQNEPKTDPTFLFKVKCNDKEYKVRSIFGDVSLELYDKRESNPDHLIYVSLDDCEIIKGGYGIKESGSPYPTKPATFSEQEPVESKFNSGDWIVCEETGSVHQIKDCVENLSNHTYGYDLTEGGYISTDNVNKYKKWIFEDHAKDGDVLADDETILLFKSYSGQYHTSLYCWYNGESDNFHEKELTDIPWNITNLHPATEEQRKLLFRKMKDAGWEWYADKKELKRL